jgi:hypothetical protein
MNGPDLICAYEHHTPSSTRYIAFFYGHEKSISQLVTEIRDGARVMYAIPYQRHGKHGKDIPSPLEP